MAGVASCVYRSPYFAYSSTQKEDEAEKMMRGVLYFRGLKKVAADVPLGVKHVVDLYEKYHFQNKQRFVHMARGTDTQIRFENIYAFSL